MNKTDEFYIHDTTIRFNTSQGWKGIGRSVQYEHYSYFYQILHMLESEGFKVEKDAEVLRDYKNISRDHWQGQRGDLEFSAKKFPAGFEITFFQNIVFDNPNGGKYDFDKLAKMPYLIRLQYLVSMRKVVEKLKTLTEAKDRTPPPAKTAEEKIRRDLVYNWHFFPDMNFDFREIREPESSYYGLDRNKKPIHNGDVKYFRDSWNGYIMRGRAYYCANMNWWVILNKREAVIVSNYDMFDDFPAGDPRRVAPNRTPKEYAALREKQEKAKADALDLIARLENHGVRVPKKARRACINEVCRKQSEDQ
ncbi:hypothetical protein NXH76_11865 [Blautia schinkii]|nr:hypothetical protein [Blautia schinkii]